MLKSAKYLSKATKAFITVFGALRPNIVPRSQAKHSPISSALSFRRSQELNAYLWRLDADSDYGTWFTVGCAIYNITNGSEEGYALFDRWSALGTKYKGPTETRSKWRSIDPNHPYPAGLYTLRKLVLLEGWDINAINAELKDPFDFLREGADE